MTADFVVAGVGVRARTDLASGAGLAVDRGVVVDARLQTSARGVYVARYPFHVTGERSAWNTGWRHSARGST